LRFSWQSLDQPHGRGQGARAIKITTDEGNEPKEDRLNAIAGLWRLDGANAGESCRRMLKAQALYGPDRSDLRADGDVALGRQLMRLVPEDAHDRQPVVAGGGRFILVADLRLDNREELAEALGLAPDRLRTASDSALLALAWERWREECCGRLIGDFAFAVWDAEQRRLILARDFAGGRPLHYHDDDRLFAFASMPKGLHALAEIPRGPDRGFALAALAGRPPAGGATMFEGIRRVLPGHILTFERRRVRSARHWRPAVEERPVRAPADAGEGLRHHLGSAVRRQLRGATRVGAHLSAGLDSTAVAASTASALEGLGTVVAFTAVPREGYEGGAPYGRLADEGPLAAATASRYANVEHVLIREGGRSPLASLDRDLFLHDQPLVNLCNMGWINGINDAARSRGLTVMMTGLRGNLAFSHNGLDLLAALLRRGRLLRLAREIAALRRRGGVGLAGGLAATLRPVLPLAAWKALAAATGRGPLRWLNGAANRDTPVPEPEDESAWREEPLPARAAGFEIVDLGNFQKAMLGGWGLDYRDPTSDRRLVEYCLSLPPTAFLSNGIRRAAAREALAGRAPEALLRETRPGLQAADWHEGASAARAALAEELERAAACPPVTELLDVPKLRRLVDQWPAEGWDRPEIDKAYRLDLLRAVSLAAFVRKASGSNA
jgi:asparagine synthase (glutamine-hydrolysing)